MPNAPMANAQRSASRIFGTVLSVVCVVVCVVASAPPLYAVPQVSLKLNHELEANKPVLDFYVSPDGSRIAYRVARTLPPAQDAPPPPAADLFSVPATGGAAIQLNPPAVNENESVEIYQFTPDGSQIVYLRTTVDATLGNVFELFRVPADGSAAPLSVSGPIPVGARATRDFDFDFAQATLADGATNTVNFRLRHRDVPERITSIQDGTSNTFFFGEQTNNLLQTPTNGTVRQINPDLISGGVVYDFEITPDGTRTIYRADQNLDGAIELFSVPADGSDVGFRISGPLVAGGDVQSFKVSSTSARAVYLADQTTNGVTELYSARTNGGIVTKLNAPLTSGGNVTQFQFTPGGTLVVYLADQLVDERFQLFGVLTTGSTPFQVSSPVNAGSVRSFLISPDGSRIFYVDNSGPGGGLRLYIRTSGPVFTTISASSGPPVANLAVPDVKVSPDGNSVVYLADNGNDGVYELTSITLDPLQNVVPQINAPLIAGGNIHGFKISPDGQRVVYLADQHTPGVLELFSVPIGGGPVEQVSGPLVAGGSAGSRALDFQFSPDSRTVYYLADQESDNLVELFAATDAPTVEFAQAGYVVAEDGSLGNPLAVQRSGNLMVASNVRVQLTGNPEGGTATGGASVGTPDNGVDFVDNARDVALASGTVSQTFTIAINNDGDPETPESFTMSLFESEQAVIGPQATAEVVILDTAGAPLLDDVTLALPENSDDDTPVPAGVASAKISAAAVTTYTIRSGNSGNAFRIDNSGTLLVNNGEALNFETNPVFILLVEARDDLGSSDIATWTIKLEDENEPPLFAPQSRSVDENSPSNTFVGARLSASDPDGDRLIFSTASSVFGITSNGQLLVKESSKLDFETQKVHTINVSVADGDGHTVVVAITVNVLDVVEGDPTLPHITKLSPASAVVGGKTFVLVVRGENFTANSVVRWNGSNRKTTFAKGALYATITTQDIATVTTAKIDVLDTGTKKTSSTAAFPVSRLAVGIAELNTAPAGTPGSAVGVVTTFILEWTHTSEPWRTMDEMDLRLTDGELVPLWVRYQEARDENGDEASTILLLNADGTPAGRGEFGEAVVLENESVRLDLAHATFQGSGDTGSNIVVRIPVVFKHAAVQAEAYTVEMYGVDDLGGEQGPNVMGTWTISTPVIYLPQMER